MGEKRDTCWATQGASLVEVMMALSIFVIVVLALTTSGFVASRTLRSGRSYMATSAVAQTKLDSLRAVGWLALAGQSGADTVEGYPVTWDVQGTNPRHVVVLVQRTVPAGVFVDTFVTYVAQ